MCFLERHIPPQTRAIEFRPIILPPIPAMAVHQDFSHTLKRTRIASVHSTTDDDESTCADDDGCSVSSDHSELIKKPQGHVSRPRSGGYNLAKMLEQSGWTPDQFVKLRVRTLSNSLGNANM
jgi:hypothetical protein